jgi:3-oxoacyl-[acyl-carrier-protein] synthase I
VRLNLLASGMVTAVGFTAPASCAAIRAGLDGIRDTRFRFRDSWLKGGQVSLPNGAVGFQKLSQMALMAVNECVASHPHETTLETALLLCVAEQGRPGRIDGQGTLLERLVREANGSSRRFHETSRLFEAGSTGAVAALELADELISEGRVRCAVVAGVDTYLTSRTVRAHYDANRLITEQNSDGFFPGEAAAAILVGKRLDNAGAVQCVGVGWGREESLPGTDLPLKGDGLTRAYEAAMSAAGFGYEGLDYRLTDIGGSQRAFKEAALALARTMRTSKDEFDIEHPADCVGSVGAASVPLLLGVALAAARKGYAPGQGVLCHCGDDNGLRAAFVLRHHLNGERS